MAKDDEREFRLQTPEGLVAEAGETLPETASNEARGVLARQD